MPKTPKITEVACPKCREPIALAAQICPHCRTEFTQEELAARKKQHGQSLAIGCGVLIVLAGALTMCVSDTESAPDVPEQVGPSAKADVLDMYASVILAAAPCDSAITLMGEAAKGGDPVATYRAADRAESTCLGAPSAMREIVVPTSVGRDHYATLIEGKEKCARAFTSKWSSARTLKKGLDDGSKTSTVAEFQEDIEAGTAASMACMVSVVGVATALGATEADLNMGE